jgi:hypothetical protein
MEARITVPHGSATVGMFWKIWQGQLVGLSDFIGFFFFLRLSVFLSDLSIDD